MSFEAYDLSHESLSPVSSVGVLVGTSEIAYQAKPYFLFAQQVDQPRKPWGIPAGKVEPIDLSPKHATMREVREETGLEIGMQGLRDFLTMPAGFPSPEKKERKVYSYTLPWGVLMAMGEWSIVHPQSTHFGGRVLKSPDIFLLQSNVLQPDASEIGALALIPAIRLFERGNDVHI